jgi:hypothetical protein
MNICYDYLEFLHEDGRTEMSEGTKRNIFVTLFPEHTQTFAQWMYIAADCCPQRDTVRVMVTFLPQSTLTVQILYKLYESETEVYLPWIHRSFCCYVFSCSTGEKLSRWCLLKWNAAGCLKLCVYIGNHIVRSDHSNSRYWLKAKCCIFDSDKEQVDVRGIAGQ